MFPSGRNRHRSPVRYRRANGIAGERIANEPLARQLGAAEVAASQALAAEVQLAGDQRREWVEVLVEDVRRERARPDGRSGHGRRPAARRRASTSRVIVASVGPYMLQNSTSMRSSSRSSRSGGIASPPQKTRRSERADVNTGRRPAGREHRRARRPGRSPRGPG